jgi:hypothetical protein
VQWQKPRTRTIWRLWLKDEESGVFVGEAIGLMRDVSPAADILTRMTKEAAALLRGRAAELIT